MTTFSVWAPKAARSVELVLPGQGRLIEMTRGDWDWWAVDVPDAGPGTDYQFSLDGGPALPDPRSQFQPDGVHGPSRVVDHGAFPWTDQLWRGAAPLSGALIYEAHIGTFTPEGTFEAAIERLPHLVGLGVTHL
ncbi:MAG TPA: malto-oligosyltrehalose trehalohydrolase, partial [Acidimicrobiia bacterium]|nr:malto-oligosyltrehalose trehalohydrolase [Acidimicrobiia bacterium]